MKPEKMTILRDDGSVWCEQWRLKDKLHREDSPTVIHYHEDGSVKSEEWRLNGKLHRENGPAYVYYHEDGSVRYEEWWVDGVRLEDI